MARICLCLTAGTIKRDLEILNQYRKYADMAELRVDCLEPNERLLIRRFPVQAGLPVILTIRRDIDGGYFTGGEGARVNLLARGLAYAEADRRRNFAFVDIEEDFNVPSLEEAAHTFGTRIIRSYHNINGVDENLSAKIKGMIHTGDEIVKVAVTAHSTADMLRLFQAGKECAAQEKILICMGRYGVCGRILAEHFGSYLSYASALSETDAPRAAAGQTDIRELAEFYRFKSITRYTKVFGVVGFPLVASSSPAFFNTIFRLEGIDAVYVPFPADSIDAFMELAGALGISGFSVTVPYKEAVLPFISEQSAEVRSIGACNTLSRCPQGWLGVNTDTRGFSDSLLAFIGKTSLKRQKLTIIGAGGAAKAAAAEVYRLGGKALILNRTVHKARDLAAAYNFAWGGIDNRGIDMMHRYQDIIIQTTSAGMEGSDSSDPLESYHFSGRELVMDLVYKPEVTPFLKRAGDAGCRYINGYDMLIRQARYQYSHFMQKEFPPQLLSRVQFDRS
ncbi:MAG: type I 3-dehydroquinate dehydratase [Treponema sp.]|nr:type I 3-dehydroquinate dehydratase [Treponema sp.]